MFLNAFQAGFLKSSAKVTLYAKPGGRKPVKSVESLDPTRPFSPRATSSPTSRTASPLRNHHISEPLRTNTATWICNICSFSNPIPSNFDQATAGATVEIPPCLACGIKPPLSLILKGLISAKSGRASQIDSTSYSTTRWEAVSPLGNAIPTNVAGQDTVVCARCTFQNHASLPECEICGATLPRGDLYGLPHQDAASRRGESPGPSLERNTVNSEESLESVKLSFRTGGDKAFYERLKGALIQKKWLLHNAPPIPKPDVAGVDMSDSTGSPIADKPLPTRPAAVGIAGLEQRGLDKRQNNELVIGNAFEDLEALMASAKEIITLAETFAAEAGNNPQASTGETTNALSDSAAALGMVTTKDMLSAAGGSDTLYLTELARNLAENLTDDRKGILKREGGIMSLIDLWAVFNRSRNGVELVSPSDLAKAAGLWEKLKLPVRLRRFKSGLMAVQRSDWTDEKTIQQLKDWLTEIRLSPAPEGVTWNWDQFGCGVTAQETAFKFGWSVGVANEELEMAEDRGVVCREEGIEGVKFWSNYLLEDME